MVLPWSNVSPSPCGGEVAHDPFHEFSPLSYLPLTVYLHARIPRAAFVPRGSRALRHPVPRPGLGRVHQPYRLAHRAGEVRDRGVHSDDEVEVGHERRGVVPGRFFWENILGQSVLRAFRPNLERYEIKPIDIKNRSQVIEVHRLALAILRDPQSLADAR